LFCGKTNLDSSLPTIGTSTKADATPNCIGFKGTVLNKRFKKGTYITANSIPIDKVIDILRNLLENIAFPKPVNDSVLEEKETNSSPATNVKKHILIAVS
jgi:hypothetical protein